jgi:hypothetical protein
LFHNKKDIPPESVTIAMARLGMTAIHTTAFFSLLALGYPPHHALPLAVALALGAVGITERFRPGGGEGRR